MDLLTRDTAPVLGHDTTTRRVTVRLCRWDDPRPVTDPDGVRYREAFPPGSLELADTGVHVTTEHHGALIGRADPSSYRDDGTGPVVDLILARTAAADDTLALIESGVIGAVSIELEPIAPDPGYLPRDTDELVIRHRARVHGVAFAFRPAHDAPILATRERPTPTEEPAMTDTDTLTDPTAAVAAALERGDVVTGERLTRTLDEFRDDLTRAMVEHTGAARGDDGVSELLRFRSLGEYARATYADPDLAPVLRRALADQITDNNPGVIPPGWVRRVFGIVDQGRAVVRNIGGGGLPEAGMDVNWPYFDGDMSTLVGEQATEKTAVTSARVDLKKGTAPIATWAGAGDIAYQLIRRSDPSYMDAYLRIMTLAWAGVTDTAAASALTAAAQASAATWDPATGTLEALAEALFVAAVEVDAATGMPPTAVLAASDVFTVAGGKAIHVTTPYGTQNTAGSANAADLSVNVAGFRVTHAKHLAAGTLIVTNTEAAQWWEDGPFTVTAEDVEKLGQDVAVWGMGTFGATIPNGIRKIAAA